MGNIFHRGEMTMSLLVKAYILLGKNAAQAEGEMRVNENIPWADMFWISNKTALHQ